MEDVEGTPCREDNVEIHVGMLFSSVEEVELLYAQYAKRLGFGILRRNSRETSVQFCCYKEGLPRKRKIASTSDRVVSEEQFGMSKTSKVGCRACLYVVFVPSSKLWRISKFNETHNHEMVSPNSLKYLRKHKKMTRSAKCLSSVFENQGIEVGKVPDVLYPTQEDVEFTRKDCYNYVGMMRRKMLDVGDAQSVYNFCVEQQEINPGFRYAIKMDEEDRMSNFFWVDSRSRIAYELFGEIVSFDTTYRTNKYNMPFALFVGIDNHMHTILFGCALLQDEREETFVWLFESWLRAMNGKSPNGFMTDQDAAIMNAAERVFPLARHRLCVWRINKKFPERLAHIYHEKSKFKHALNHCIYGSRTIAYFEESWERLVHEYNLLSNDWLMNLYSFRHKWVPVFSKDVFFGGMNTTGRSESINSFFDAFVHSGTTLKQFVAKYGQAIERRYESFRKAEFDTRHKVPTLTLGMGLEEHAAQIYTSEIFCLFHGELMKILSYSRELVAEVGTCKTYKVWNRLDKIETVFVQFDTITHDSVCECKLYESQGILCGHICNVYFEHNIEQIPRQYILHRWTKHVGRVLWEHPIARDMNDIRGVRSFTYREYFDELSYLGDNYECLHGHILNGLSALKVSTNEMLVGMTSINHLGSSTTPENTRLSGQESRINIADPNIVVTKGRRKTSQNVSTRIRSGIEISSENRVRCSVCFTNGHNRRTCPLSRVNDM